MTYRTLAWVMALICGLAIPSGAATSADDSSIQQIFQPALKADVQGNDLLAATTAQGEAGSIIVVDNALLVSVHGNAMLGNVRRLETTFNKTTVASLNNSYNNSTGVANINVASGNLNTQTINFSGPDLSSSGLLATGGSVKAAGTSK